MFLFLPWWIWGLATAGAAAVGVAAVTVEPDAPVTAPERVEAQRNWGAVAVVLGIAAVLAWLARGK